MKRFCQVAVWQLLVRRYLLSEMIKRLFHIQQLQLLGTDSRESLVAYDSTFSYHEGDLSGWEDFIGHH